MDLLALISNPTGLLAGILAAIIAALGLYAKGRGDGKQSSDAKAAKADAKSKEDQLEMFREADAIERANQALSDEEARKKAGRKLT